MKCVLEMMNFALQMMIFVLTMTDFGAAEHASANDDVHNFAAMQELLAQLLRIIEEFTSLYQEVDAILTATKAEDGIRDSYTEPDDAEKAARTVVAELLMAAKAAATGLLTPVQTFCEANVRRAVRAGLGASDDAAAGSERITTMWDILLEVGKKATEAEAAAHELADRSGKTYRSGVEIASRAGEILVELDQLWNDSVDVELPAEQQNPWVDGLEALLLEEMATTKARGRINAAHADAALQKEKAEVKRLQLELFELEAENRTLKADKDSVAAETAARDARVREWTASVVVGATNGLAGQFVAAREKGAWTSEDAVEGHRWSAKKLHGSVTALDGLIANPGTLAAPADEEGNEGVPEEELEPAEALPLDEWLGSLTAAMKVLHDASTKGTRDMIAQWGVMREEVVKYECALQPLPRPPSLSPCYTRYGSDC